MMKLLNRKVGKYNMIIDKRELKDIPQGYKQTFQNRWSNNISKNQILTERYEDKITDRDIEMLKFIAQFRFVTGEQVFRMLMIKDLTDKEQTSENSIVIRLDKLVKKRLINRFMLDLNVQPEIHEDALSMYCLDYGGKLLLENYTNDEFLMGWKPAEFNICSADVIANDIAIVDIYLKILESVGEKLVAFHTRVAMCYDKQYVLFPFEFTIQHNGELKYFLGDTMTALEVMSKFRTKIDKFDKILSSNAWKKYYPEDSNQPMLLFFVEDMNSANEVARMTAETGIDRFRVTTDDLFKKEMSIAFMSYKEGELKQGKSAVFTKETI